MIIPSCKVMFLFLMCHWILKLWAFYLAFNLISSSTWSMTWSLWINLCTLMFICTFAICQLPFWYKVLSKVKIFAISQCFLTFWKLQTWWVFFCGATCCGNCDNMYAVQILLFVWYKDLTVTLFLLIILAWELHNILHKKCSFLSLENTPGFWKLFMVS